MGWIPEEISPEEYDDLVINTIREKHRQDFLSTLPNIIIDCSKEELIGTRCRLLPNGQILTEEGNNFGFISDLWLESSMSNTMEKALAHNHQFEWFELKKHNTK